jgi:hypothetical protein
MLATLLLFALIAMLMLLAKWLYSTNTPAPVPEGQPPDPREDRLASLILPELMESLMNRSRREERSVLDLLESLIREGLEREPGEVDSNPPG